MPKSKTIAPKSETIAEIEAAAEAAESDIADLQAGTPGGATAYQSQCV